MIDAAGYAMVCIEPGTFTMGSPETEDDRDDDEAQHQVTLTRRFAVGTTEVTNALWEAVMGENPSDCEVGCTANHPASTLGWDESIEFVNQLSDDEGLGRVYEIVGDKVLMDLDADGYRLLTEAEWEYAARAEDGTVWPGSDDPETVCWSYELGENESHLVGLLPPNGWGLYDLCGNQGEWVWDHYDDYPAGPVTDPTGPFSATFRVHRGGSWSLAHRYNRIASRSFDTGGAGVDWRGLRIGRTMPD